MHQGLKRENVPPFKHYAFMTFTITRTISLNQRFIFEMVKRCVGCGVAPKGLPCALVPRHGVQEDVGMNSTLTRQSAVLGRQVSPSMPAHARPAGTNHRSRHSSANIPARSQITAKTCLVQWSTLTGSEVKVKFALENGRKVQRGSRFTELIFL
jgi:hypothetical protein